MRKFIIVYASVLICPAPAWAGSVSPEEFHRKVYVLHQQQIAQREIRTQEKTDNYSGAAAAGYGFVDTRYYDASSGRLLSYVRRDAAKPENLHIVEVNVYQNGRLVRDFGSWRALGTVKTCAYLHQSAPLQRRAAQLPQYDLHEVVRILRGLLPESLCASRSTIATLPRRSGDSGLQCLLRRHGE